LPNRNAYAEGEREQDSHTTENTDATQDETPQAEQSDTRPEGYIPIYPKLSKKDISRKTLEYYDVPWFEDPVSPRLMGMTW
jgi:hypothetical protein